MHVCFDSDDIDQSDLLFQSIARMERTARKAEESGQFAVVVGWVAQLNKMMALVADQKGFRSQATLIGADCPMMIAPASLAKQWGAFQTIRS